MALFNFGKKKEEKEMKTLVCACQGVSLSEEAEYAADERCPDVDEKAVCSIKVLGAGCKSCHEQYENTLKAVKDLGILAEPEYITDMQKVMEYGVMSMPALVVNEKVVSMGRVLKTDDVIDLFHKLGYKP